MDSVQFIGILFILLIIEFIITYDIDQLKEQNKQILNLLKPQNNTSLKFIKLIYEWQL